MKRKEVYPVTREFEEDVRKLLTKTYEDDCELVGILRFTFGDITDIALSTVGEYEHGTADVQDCEGVTLKQYKAVLHDFLLCLMGSIT